MPITIKDKLATPKRLSSKHRSSHTVAVGQEQISLRHNP